MRLSEKDEKCGKTMNTHLHIMEAYTTLYEVTRLPEVKEALENLTNLFLNKFLDEKTQHFQLFLIDNGTGRIMWFLLDMILKLPG